MHAAESSESVETTDVPSSRERHVITPSLRQYGLRAIVILFTLNAIDERRFNWGLRIMRYRIETVLKLQSVPVHRS